MIRWVNRKGFEGPVTATIASTADKLPRKQNLQYLPNPRRGARLRREEVELEHYRNSLGVEAKPCGCRTVRCSQQPKRSCRALSTTKVRGMSRVMRIYVSSTYMDLRDCGQKVYNAIRCLGHEHVAMEHYVAEPERAVDRRLADIT